MQKPSHLVKKTFAILVQVATSNHRRIGPKAPSLHALFKKPKHLVGFCSHKIYEFEFSVHVSLTRLLMLPPASVANQIVCQFLSKKDWTGCSEYDSFYVPLQLGCG